MNLEAMNLEAALTGPTLYPWDTNEGVAELQALLRAYGFSLKIDGCYGDVTEAAVKAFQKQQGLLIDGVVGPKTWAMLKGKLPIGSRSLCQGCTGIDVYELQGLLQVQGYEVDRHGCFDEKTYQAVLAFQAQHRLRQDGVVGLITWTVLRNGTPLPPLPKQGRWFLNGRKWW